MKQTAPKVKVRRKCIKAIDKCEVLGCKHGLSFYKTNYVLTEDNGAEQGDRESKFPQPPKHGK